MSLPLFSRFKKGVTNRQVATIVPDTSELAPTQYKSKA